MKKTLLLLLIVYGMSACRIQFIPLKGNYPSDYTVVYNKSADEVLTNIIEYCLENNISLRAVDRKNGLIMSEPYKINTYTFEDSDGTPKDSSASAIIGFETMKILKGEPFEPEVIMTDIIFMVKEENNKTSMTVTLANVAAYIIEGGSCLREVKSTGFLEKKIIEGIK